MRWRSGRAAAIGVTAVLLASAGCSASGRQASTSSTARAAPSAPTLAPGDCPMEVPASAEVTCSWLTVPADRDDAERATMRLPVAQISGGPDAVGRTPVVVIEGGPGVGSLEKVAGYADIATSTGRDFVLWDQRGTGHSTPSLACDELPLAPGTDVPASNDPILAECALGAGQAGIDLEDYSAVASEADLEDLRVALGVDRWNLWANSYGTVIAQHALRAHPGGISTALIGAPVRLDQGILHVSGRTLGSAMGELDGACQADGNCRSRYGDLEALTEQAIAAIAESDARTEPDEVRRTLFRALYASDDLGRIPAILQAATEGEASEAMADLVAIDGANHGDVSVLQQAAMWCNDSGGIEPRDPTCDDLDIAPGPASSNEPLEGTEVPVMVVFGRFDPVIARADAQAVADDLGVPLTTVEASHDAIRASACVQQLWARWLDDPIEAPDDPCVRAPLTFE